MSEVLAQPIMATTEPICRHCRETASEDRPLYEPCQCKGTLASIHHDCLTTWREYVKSDYLQFHCQTCKAPYELGISQATQFCIINLVFIALILILGGTADMKWTGWVNWLVTRTIRGIRTASLCGIGTTALKEAPGQSAFWRVIILCEMACWMMGTIQIMYLGTLASALRWFIDFLGCALMYGQLSLVIKKMSY
jgi:hypothetical protein